MQAQTIEAITRSLKIPVAVVSVTEAPQAFRYTIQPLLNERGTITKVASLRSHADDIALALRVPNVRIVQEGSLVIEVPKPVPSTVPASALCSLEAGPRETNLLPIRLGQTVEGPTLVLDLAGAPHLLIAGTTGSGKSVCVKNLIAELVRWNPPVASGWEKRFQRGEAGRAVELRLIDVNRVELAQFRGVWHVSALETEYQGATNLLARTLTDVEWRYRAMQKASVSHIGDTNNLHYILIIIDEFAGLVLQDSSVVQLIVRIAQLGRAAGVHLIISTQRPSVNVIAGLIKVNFPTRICFRVASGVDSRIVIEQTGAEKLLGKGDGLLLAADIGLMRFQGAWPDDVRQIISQNQKGVARRLLGI